MSSVAERSQKAEHGDAPFHLLLHDVRMKSAAIRKKLARGKITPEEAEKQLEELRSQSSSKRSWRSFISGR